MYKGNPTDPALHFKSMAFKHFPPSEQCGPFIFSGDDIASKTAEIGSGGSAGHRIISFWSSKELWYIKRYTLTVFYFNLTL